MNEAAVSATEAHDEDTTPAQKLGYFLGIPDLKIPSAEEMRAKREAAYAWTRALIAHGDIATRGETSAPARMNILSLPAWLAVAEAAGVPFIPARQIAECGAERFRESLENGDDDTAYEDFQLEILKNLKEDEMIRMEQVTPRTVKAALSEGEPMNNGAEDIGSDGGIYDGLYIDLYEDRFLSTFLDLGADVVRAFARPIVEPLRIDGKFHGKPGSWPAEFRVYIQNGEIVGISNYYPQVAMDPEAFRPQAETALRYAQSMLDAMEARRLGVGGHSLAPDIELEPSEEIAWKPKPWVPAHWDRQDATLDFMVLEDRSVIFLEGGPAGMRAAHPCCFLQEGRANGPGFLHGAAFSLTDPIQPLDAFLPRD